MFPHLDDIFLEHISHTDMTWARGGHEFEHVPSFASFAGTFECLGVCHAIRPALLSWITSFPLRFHTVTSDMLESDDVPIFRKLFAACAPTLQDIPQIMFNFGA